MKQFGRTKICMLFLCVLIMWNGVAMAEEVTLRLLVEDVPDTHVITPYLPEFEAETGIKVEFEVVQYLDMHSKLVPQFLTSNASYDVIVVDNYWAGEFPAAGWLEPLDEYVERDNIDISKYIPAMLDMVGYYPITGSDKQLYMLPFYNYTMCLVYRADLMEDAALQAKYKELYGKDMVLPQSMADYVQMCKFMQDNAGVYGSAMQAGRGDPIVMEWSNYLFALDGDYYDDNWNATINDNKSIQAIKDYMENINQAAPKGALNFNLDDAFRVMSQGQAWSMITYNWMLVALDDPEKSKVAGQVAIAPMPEGKSLAGGWGWGIAHNSSHKEEAWQFIKWVESFDIAKRRALNGGAPTRSDVLLDPEVLAKYPHYKVVEEILAKSKPVPEFQYSTQMVEIVGRELSLIGAEGKDHQTAMDEAAKELDELAKKAKLQ